MISFKDLNLIEERLRSVFVTKDEFKESLTNFKSDIFDKLDSFVKEVRDSHEERILVSGKLLEIEDRVEKLESAKVN